MYLALIYGLHYIHIRQHCWGPYVFPNNQPKNQVHGGEKNLKDERKTTNNSVLEKLFEVLILILFIS